MNQRDGLALRATLPSKNPGSIRHDLQTPQTQNVQLKDALDQAYAAAATSAEPSQMEAERRKAYDTSHVKLLSRAAATHVLRDVKRTPSVLLRWRV